MSKILVIDDDEQIRNFLKEILTSEGYEVASVDNGSAGLDWLDNETCDLLITDIFMPEKEGVGLIQELSKRSSTFKIIAISGGGTHMNADQALNIAEILGASHTLAKPFTKHEILPLVIDLVPPSHEVLYT